MKIQKNGFNKDYLSKDATLAIKGIFILCVFLSHARSYIEFSNPTDVFVIKILNYLGQLMVTLFLFYSGYGVYESIKKKGQHYIHQLPINRIGKTFFDFSIAILLFWILSLFMNNQYPISRVLLSLTGWVSIGNSNWYMFAIFTLYIITYISFMICKDKNILGLIFVTVLSLLYVYIMSDIKPNAFSNTYLCYAMGMWISFFRDRLENFFDKYKLSYYIIFVLLFVVYIYVSR